VTATSPGLEGALLFCASADPVEPERIVRIVGDTHLGALRAAVDAEAPFPLRAQVFDALGNPLVGVPVTFRVDRGGGQLLDSAGDRLAEAVVSTDAEGRAQMRFVLGPEVGVDSHRVKADFFGLTSLPAVFSITGVTPGPESETRVGGVVLDNEDEPVPGATVRVLADGLAEPPEAITDADGRFEIAGAPVGTVDLEVDGPTTTRAGRWPVLHYVFDTIAGTRNDIGMPVRLLPIDSGAIVGGDQDVTIPIAGVAGGELTIFANSATFPDGSTVGEVSVTQVHGDKVPMLPPMGSSFMLAWTVQPPGTRFDPPAQISIPNMGDSPGAVVDIFSFDHDLGEFVPIGTATVSDDGTRVTSNRGSGVVKAGWHGCVPPPLDPTDICQPSSCKQCNADGELEPLCEEDCETCDDGTCTPRRFESLTVLGLGSDGEDSEDTIVVGVNQTVDFDRRAEENCKDEEYEWDLGDGESASGKTAEHAYDEPGVYTVTLTASCLGCDSAEATDTLQVRVLELDLIVDGLAEESDDKSSGPNEEMPGAFAVLNDDDDNDNDTDDLDESGQIEGEDDLVEAKIEFDREAEDGELRLEASAGGDKILVWTTETKEELVELPKTWDLSDGDVDVPEAVWLEAVSGSTELRDIELMLVFEAETVTEPIEDMVALTSLALEFDVAPRDEEGGSDGSLGVSADAGEMTLAAAVFVRSLEDPEEFLPVEDGAEVEWDVEGDGNTGGTSVTENGIAGTTLSLGGDAGIRGQGIARLTKFAFGEGDDRTEVEVTVERRTAQLEIFPGEAAEIELDASSFVVAADDTDVVELTATIRDEAGNEVSDGTPVSWFSERSDSPFLSTETQTAGGIARATLKASLLPGTVDVYVQAGLAERREEISFEALTAALSSSDSVLTLEGGAPIEISLSTNASDGTPVEWSTSNGTVGLQSTVSGGQTRTILNSTGATPGPVVVTATIGTKLATWTGEARQFGEFSIFVKDRFLTAGRDENSLDIFTRPDGTQSLVPINGRTEVEVVGIPGSTVQVLGSGVEIAEAYNFEALDDNGDVPGLVGGLPIVLNGGQLDDALAFTGESSLLIQEQDSGVVPYSDALA
ncbi:MAG: PKD domain-containing protein, partial [Acidobacteriota bacterium]